MYCASGDFRMIVGIDRSFKPIWVYKILQMCVPNVEYSTIEDEILDVVDELRGEMVIVMDGFKQDDVVFDMYTAITKVDEYIESGMRTKEAIGLVAKEMACKKNELYEAYHKR